MSERANAHGARLPGSYLAASYLSHALSTVGSAVAVTFILLNPHVWPGPWLAAVFALIFVFRMVEPLYEWGTTRVRISDSEITVATGLLNRRRRSIRWNAIRTVESTAPWAHRAFGLFVVRIAQGGDLSTQVTLAGVTRATRDIILAYSPVQDSASDPAPDSEADATPEAEERIEEPAPVSTPTAAPAPVETAAAPDARLYRATLGDLVFSSVLFGRFAIVGVAAAFALYEQLDRFGLLGILAFFQGGGAIGFSVFVALVILGIGITASVVGYARFEVRRLPGGGIGVSYGLIETHERAVDAAAITGVVLQRNPLEMLLGRVRLALLTTDTSQQFGANLLLPSLPRRTVSRILAEGLGDRVPSANLATRRRLPLISTALFAIVTAAAVALGSWLVAIGVPLGFAILAALIAWGATVVAVRPLVTRIAYDDGLGIASVRTLFIVDREIHLDVLAIHLLTGTGFRASTRYVTLHYYAGEARQRGSFWFSEPEMRQLQSRLGDRAERIARIATAREQASLRREALGEIDQLVTAKE